MSSKLLATTTCPRMPLKYFNVLILAARSHQAESDSTASSTSIVLSFLREASVGRSNHCLQTRTTILRRREPPLVLWESVVSGEIEASVLGHATATRTPLTDTYSAGIIRSPVLFQSVRKQVHLMTPLILQHVGGSSTASGRSPRLPKHRRINGAPVFLW